MLEKTLLGVLSDPDNYAKYKKYIRKDHVTKEIYRVIQDGLGWWFEHSTDPADWDKIQEYMMFSVLTGESSDSKALYKQAMDSPTASGAPAEAVLRSLTERLYFSDISVMAQDIGEGLGTYDADDIKDMLDRYYDEARVVLPLPPMSASDILASMKKTAGAGLRWRLEELNVSLGDLRKGNLVLVAARTESGKTTFLVDQTVDFLRQSDKPLLYLTNEDPREGILHRYLQSGLDKTHTEIEVDPDGYNVDFEKMYGTGLNVLDMNESERTHWDQIEDMVIQMQPSCVVIDQLRNVRGFSDCGTEIARLKELFQSARSLASRVCPIIVAHQLDGSATGELYPNEHQLEGSRTEVQGTLDAQIMLGRSYQPGFEDIRGMNIVKNKMGKGSKAVHSQRHGRFELRIKDDIQRFKGTL